MPSCLARGVALASVALIGSLSPLSAQTARPGSTPDRTQAAGAARSPAVARPGPFDARLAGTWELRISSSFVYHTDGRNVYQSIAPGADLERLRIEANGRYEWGRSRGQLLEVHPPHAQEGRRYYRVAAANGDEFDLYFQDQDRTLALLFGGVGGGVATGRRVGGGADAASFDRQLVGSWIFPSSSRLGITRNRLVIAASGGYEWGSTEAAYTALRGTLTLGEPAWGRPGVRYYGGLGTFTEPRFVAFVDGGVAIYTGEGQLLGSTAGAAGSGAPASGRSQASAARPATPPAPSPGTTDPLCGANPLGVVFAQCGQSQGASPQADAAGAAGGAATPAGRYTCRVTRPQGGEPAGAMPLELRADGTYGEGQNAGRWSWIWSSGEVRFAGGPLAAVPRATFEPSGGGRLVLSGEGRQIECAQQPGR